MFQSGPRFLIDGAHYLKIKIGESGDVVARRNSLQTGNPDELTIIHSVNVEDKKATETLLHKHYSEFGGPKSTLEHRTSLGVGGGQEWFCFAEKDVESVKEKLDSYTDLSVLRAKLAAVNTASLEAARDIAAAEEKAVRDIVAAEEKAVRDIAAAEEKAVRDIAAAEENMLAKQKERLDALVHYERALDSVFKRQRIEASNVTSSSSLPTPASSANGRDHEILQHFDSNKKATYYHQGESYTYELVAIEGDMVCLKRAGVVFRCTANAFLQAKALRTFLAKKYNTARSRRD